MSNRTGPRALQIVGLLTLITLGVRKAATSDEPWLPPTLGAVAVIGLTVLGFWLWTRRADRIDRETHAARPGWHTRTVWADESLGATLTGLGASVGKVRGGTRLTLAWTATTLEIRRGANVAATVPWSRVWTITRTTGRARSSGNPAVELITREHARFVLVPARRPDGGMLPASATQVDALVAELRAVREAASVQSTPPALP